MTDIEQIRALAGQGIGRYGVEATLGRKMEPDELTAFYKAVTVRKLKIAQKKAQGPKSVAERVAAHVARHNEVGDFNVKVRNAQKFLNDGNRVKVTVRFRGREMAHTDIGRNLLVQFGEACSEIANVEKNPKLDGRHMSMFLGPKPQSK